MAWRSAALLPRQELCHRQLDPQQLVARMRHHVWTNHTGANFAVFRLARPFVNLLLVRMTFAPIVNFQLVRTSL